MIVENSVQHFIKIHAYIICQITQFGSVLYIITSTCIMVIIVTANTIIIVAIVTIIIW